jgi:hypothetical protein
MRTATVAIACDVTGLPTGPTERDVEADDYDLPIDELFEAPDGWLVMIAVRVRPNPAYGREQPTLPANLNDPAALQRWMDDSRAVIEAQESPYIVDQALFHMASDKAALLDKALPGCWENLEGFDDLAATAQGAQP